MNAGEITFLIMVLVYFSIGFIGIIQWYNDVIKGNNEDEDEEEMLKMTIYTVESYLFWNNTIKYFTTKEKAQAFIKKYLADGKLDEDYGAEDFTITPIEVK